MTTSPTPGGAPRCARQSSGRTNADADGGDGDGVVSSNLTFDLAPGSGFVRSEGWRVDYGRQWALQALDTASLSAAHIDPTDKSDGEVVADPMEMGDGWVYTNDAWGGQASGVPFPGSVTRRQTWVRRIGGRIPLFDGPVMFVRICIYSMIYEAMPPC
ncbi:hypothetical protein H0H92_010453 [Tricholoma furcatifolium]|nr:hypothetical protein H0H92_010453 [Tricholoma furcatifolium]